MTTQHTGPLASLVAKLRYKADEASLFDPGIGDGIKIAADRIEKLIAEMCDVALERCVNGNAPEIGVNNEPCEVHSTFDKFRTPVRWGTFTQQEAN